MNHNLRKNLLDTARRLRARGEYILASVAEDVAADMDAQDNKTAKAELSPKQEAYQRFFLDKLAKFGVSSPADLSVEDKSRFFNEIKDEWKGDATAAYHCLCANLAEEDSAATAEDKQQTAEKSAAELEQEVDDKMTVISGLIVQKRPFIFTSTGSIELT